jgi:hypothetical protein
LCQDMSLVSNPSSDRLYSSYSSAQVGHKLKGRSEQKGQKVGAVTWTPHREHLSRQEEQRIIFCTVST